MYICRYVRLEIRNLDDVLHFSVVWNGDDALDLFGGNHNISVTKDGRGGPEVIVTTEVEIPQEF